MNENNANSLKNSKNITGNIMFLLFAPLIVAVALYMKQSIKTDREQKLIEEFRENVKHIKWPTL